MEETEANLPIEEEAENDFIPAASSVSNSMSENEQRIRRASIRAILAESGLSQKEKSKLVQCQMDGRRRPSIMNDYNSECRSRESFQCSDQQVSEGSQFPLKCETTWSAFTTEYSSSPSSSLQQSDRSFESMSESSDMDIDEDIYVRPRPITLSCVECTHYERNCNIISPCCDMIFGCRLCHDDCTELPPPISGTARSSLTENLHQCQIVPNSSQGTSQSQTARNNSLDTFMASQMIETHHNIDRFAISEIVCKKCSTRQSSKTNTCINCKVQFGEYHCSICNLWMSNEEKPYHCSECGFCRIGGAENFRHCTRCGMCIAVSIFEHHDCKEGKYKCSCPVCQEDLFSSRSLSHGMRCGHAIHWHCYQELIKFDSRCPVCKKTSDNFLSMMHTWEAMAVSVAMQPVPTELARLVTIQCNDCEVREENRWWHVIGTQCKSCLSFNTNIEKIQLTGQEARDYMGGEANSKEKERGDAHALVLATGKWLSENNVQEED